jgi:hypothetical protein
MSHLLGGTRRRIGRVVPVICEGEEGEKEGRGGRKGRERESGDKAGWHEA